MLFGCLAGRTPLGIAALVACAGAAHAQPTAAWTNPAGGSFFSTGNWEGGVVPNSGRQTYFDERAGGTALTYTVSIGTYISPAQSEALYITANSITLDFTGSGGDYTVGSYFGESVVVGQKFVFPSNRSGSLTILNNGPATRALMCQSVEVGTASGPLAQLLVRGSKGRVEANTYIEVGSYGDGDLTVDQSGYMKSLNLLLAYNTATYGSGQVTISGSGSKLEYDSLCALGYGNGPASMNITSGGGAAIHRIRRRNRQSRDRDHHRQRL